MITRTFLLIPVLITILLAALLWFVTFYVSWGIFWFKISLSAAMLAGISLWLTPRERLRFRMDVKSAIIGFVSAAALYAVFWIGKLISIALFSSAHHQLGAIYGKGEEASSWVIALLLFFVTGPSEEIYWRGYLQRNLMRHFGSWQGWIIAALVYAGVHIWSFNFMLIGAAAVAGAFWGALYWRLKNLAPVIISHSVWSMVIFAILPLA